MSDLALGLDIGTSGTRSAVLGPGGDVVATARVEHEPPGADNVDAEEWWRSARSCIRRQVARLEESGINSGRIGRIAVDGTSGSMVLTDGNLRPVSRGLMYDSSGFETEARRIAKVAPPDSMTRGPGSALARALRLVAEDSAGRARHLLHQADFVTARLTGVGGESDSNNSLKTGAEPESGRWPDWIPATGIDPHLLPRVNSPGSALRQIDPKTARDLGLGGEVVVHVGTTDSVAAFLACAPLAPGSAATSLGSTLAIKILSPKRVENLETGVYSHRVAGLWLAGGASNTGGRVLQEFFSADRIRELSRQIDPGIASPLDYYPLAAPGERFPERNPDLQPRMSPRPDDDADFLHGILEGIARIERRCYEAVVECGGPWPTSLRTSGGGAENRAWTAIRERVLGLVPEQATETEACVGVARLAQGQAASESLPGGKGDSESGN